MTFIDMARSAFGDLPEARLRDIANLMEEAYCEALRSCSWRLGGIDYLFDGPGTKTLREIIDIVQKKEGPL